MMHNHTGIYRPDQKTEKIPKNSLKYKILEEEFNNPLEGPGAVARTRSSK